MDPANRQQSVRSATRFLITLSESIPRETVVQIYTGRFIMFSVLTNIYNKKTKGRILMEFFTATGKLKKAFFF